MYERGMCRLIASLLAAVMMLAMGGSATAALAEAPAAVEAFDVPALSDRMTATQRNSINMLNHLVVLTQEINSSHNSRLYLEEAYASLVNNTYPNAVDERAQEQIEFLLDQLEGCRMLSVKRERLQHIYEENYANALRAALPAELAIIGLIPLDVWKPIAEVIVRMEEDSYESYQSEAAAAELAYLQDGWALDDEEQQVIHSLRRNTFSYIVETVREYDLPGEYALTEQAVADYVRWAGNDNLLQRIQYFEANRATYQAYGPYWLMMAESYYSSGDYLSCLRAIETYRALDIRIFRRDYELARVLALGVVAARAALSEAQYADVAARYAGAILENTDNASWALRYFAAQVFSDLYGITGDRACLQKTYDTALNNVNYLLEDQRALNAAYIADVKTVDTALAEDSSQKKEIKSYNKMLKELRSSELPPILEPLRLNCDLLYSAAKALGVSEAEQARIDGMLHPNGEQLFFCTAIDDQYWFESSGHQAREDVDVEFAPGFIMVDVRDVPPGMTIRVTAIDGGVTCVFDDWTLWNVARPTKGDISTFYATYYTYYATSSHFDPDSIVHVELIPQEGMGLEKVVAEFRVDYTYRRFLLDIWEYVRIR